MALVENQKVRDLSEVLAIIVATCIVSSLLGNYVEPCFSNEFAGVIVFWLLFTAITCSLIYVVRRLVDRWCLRDFGLTVEGFKTAVLLGLVIPAPLLTLQCMASLAVVGSLLPQVAEFFEEKNSVYALVVAFLVYPVLTLLWASFHEEFRYRGYMQNLLERSFGSTVALIGVAVFFSYGHYWGYVKLGLRGPVLFCRANLYSATNDY